MQRTKLRNGMEVQVNLGYWQTAEAVIVTTDIDVAHRTHRAANGSSRYGFQGAWDQAIAIAVKQEDGTWNPRVTTTRKVLGTVEAYQAEQKAEADARIEEQLRRTERAELAAANERARREVNPAAVKALNEFVGVDNAFRIDTYGQGHVTVNDRALLAALVEKLGLEVL